jgi:type I restriction enzyme S subunit
VRADAGGASSRCAAALPIRLAGREAVTGPQRESGSGIVRRVDELFALADGLEAKYRAVVERVEKLTPSVLAKAFRGELVPQDPGDEPAEKLLERIRAARASEDRSGSAGRGPGRSAGSGGRGLAAVKVAAGKMRGRR